jgi:hypothetical protein
MLSKEVFNSLLGLFQEEVVVIINKFTSVKKEINYNNIYNNKVIKVS